MSYHTSYQLVRKPLSDSRSFDFNPDRMAVITTLHRIASVAIERVMLMMNNTEMCKIRRLDNIEQALIFLAGNHDDEGMSGDRGDFYRRKLADQMHVAFAVEGVTHYNVFSVVKAAIVLEQETRKALAESAKSRDVAPYVEIDETILDILARLADIF
ncbi:uncharacterized protein LOC132740623 [Ruditapes philippinarum]|jgi:hypothetical protein|uniref:uncharacterized protein LOC132740623 n=1 Tax=Ruditapes philippinarum TaxID=129788 RepID=UPI00295BC0DE|nr:uncharacterized protein LOC132740623 [Ruditapes philippinarum]XP_060584550.1 uncharacterized protein LOC132740623 [Ruditapes philippinarum]XP_060584551.1 uncharacterized protein LOC132740623 [Ruditapes philippinarum]